MNDPRPPLRTRWRIVGLAGMHGGPRVTGLNVELVVDTTAPDVVAAIEAGAVGAGIVISRLREPDQELEP